MSFQRQSEYYEEPGSEYRDHSENERFVQLGRAASEAFYAVEELAGRAALFLSERAIEALRELVREDWNAAFGSVHPGEYIDRALSLVRAAQEAVLAAAKAELAVDGA